MVRSHRDLCDLKAESQTAPRDIPGFIKGWGRECDGEKAELGASSAHLRNGFPVMRNGARGQGWGQLLNLQQGSTPYVMLESDISDKCWRQDMV